MRAILKLKTPVNAFDVDLEENELEAHGYEKVRRGEWVSSNAITSFAKCSCCGATKWYRSPYCPECGARMSKGSEK